MLHHFHGQCGFPATTERELDGGKCKVCGLTVRIGVLDRTACMEWHHCCVWLSYAWVNCTYYMKYHYQGDPFPHDREGIALMVHR